MARKVTNRKELRKQAEAADAKEGGEKKKKAATRKKGTRTKRTKEKTPVRMKLIWAIYSGTMKEEARFPYEQKSEAEAKMDDLRSKSKKMYFIMPLKEPIVDVPPPTKE